VALAIQCQISAALQASLAATAPAAADPVQAPPGLADSEVAAPSVEIKPGNLDLLLDVELAVTLRFGARSMLLREILELGTGAVVELDRRVEEPADLLLDGRLIARGEVVVVDGNYGLRVLEVILPRAGESLAREMSA
jgi:flagellar motor switch protein FliN